MTDASQQQLADLREAAQCRIDALSARNAATEQERDAARQQLAELRAAVEEMIVDEEWTVNAYAEAICSHCGNYRQAGHHRDCWYRNVRALLTAQP